MSHTSCASHKVSSVDVLFFFFSSRRRHTRLQGDWSSDVCSSDLASGPGATFRGAIVALNAQTGRILWRSYSLPDNGGLPGGYAGATMFSPPAVEIGRASCRERVEISGVAVSFKKKNKKLKVGAID